jgi:1,3-beta-glucanosyltransferase GAS1
MELYTNWTGTVDAFAGYDNLLFFNIGNEVISDVGRSLKHIL